MGWFDEDHSATQAYNTVCLSFKPCVTLVVTLMKYNDCPPEQHQATLSHEVIGGAAAYEV